MKIFSVLVIFTLISPQLMLTFNLDDLRVSSDENLGKPGWLDNLWSGQLFLDWIYGSEKVSVKIFDQSLKIDSLSINFQQVIVKIIKSDIPLLEDDYPTAEIEYLYNDTDYSYIVVEMEQEKIAQKFWSHLLGNSNTLADKSYVQKITLNQQMTLITPLDYADEDDVCRTTYELCEDYGILDLNYTGEGISIAVLDTGVNRDHNGFTNNTSGYNTTIYNESFVPDENWVDHNGHGTHCIGIIAGQNTTVDGVEMRGVAPNATIYSLKVLDSKGRGSESDIVLGIRRAVELNCDIISMSLGGSIDYFSALHDAIHYAVGKGVIVVAAAGNSADIVSAQPASWEGVISVEALNEQKKIAPYTCLGGDISAEGTNITSLAYNNDNGTSTKSGTSMACPFVAGCIALLLEAKPSLRGKPTQVTTYLKTTGSFAPISPKSITVGYFIPATPSTYCYDTREVNPDKLVELDTVSDSTRVPITDIRTQLLRTNGV